MPDDYIDPLECLEYGDHFVDQSKQLIGLSPLVDIDALRTYVSGAQKAVATELEKQGIKHSDLRLDRKDVDAGAVTVRKAIEQFYNYLGSLDDDVPCDREAFFPGGNLGKLAQVKPADLVARAAKILTGFAASANMLLPDAAKWKTKLEDARATLAQAASGKGSSRVASIQSTAALTTARDGFLTAYNGVAKRLVQAALIHQGRQDEYRLFFKDLQVNEGGGAAAPAAPAAPAPPGPAQPPGP